jgi:hypothetical protein
MSINDHSPFEAFGVALVGVAGFGTGETPGYVAWNENNVGIGIKHYSIETIAKRG